MAAIKNYLLATVGVLILVVTLASLKSQNLDAQGPPFGNVTVVNTSANPVPVTGLVRDVDNAARHPFQDIGLGLVTGSFGLVIDITTVPPGKRLVIEFVSLRVTIPAGQNAFRATIATTAAGRTVLHELVLNRQGPDLGGNDTFVTSSQVRLYADPGTQVEGQVNRNDISGALRFGFSISGYLVDS